MPFHWTFLPFFGYTACMPLFSRTSPDSIIYRKRAINRTEIERSFFAAKGFNTTLVPFLLPDHVISYMHVQNHAQDLARTKSLV